MWRDFFGLDSTRQQHSSSSGMYIATLHQSACAHNQAYTRKGRAKADLPDTRAHGHLCAMPPCTPEPSKACVRVINPGSGQTGSSRFSALRTQPYGNVMLTWLDMETTAFPEEPPPTATGPVKHKNPSAYTMSQAVRGAETATRGHTCEKKQKTKRVTE